MTKKILFFLVLLAGCQETVERKNEGAKMTTVSKAYNESLRNRQEYFLAERKELLNKAGNYLQKLETRKDSLSNLPLESRNTHDFETLNKIIDKEELLLNSIKEAQSADPSTWDIHHKLLKAIFDDIDRFINGKDEEHCNN